MGATFVFSAVMFWLASRATRRWARDNAPTSYPLESVRIGDEGGGGEGGSGEGAGRGVGEGSRCEEEDCVTVGCGGEGVELGSMALEVIKGVGGGGKPGERAERGGG